MKATGVVRRIDDLGRIVIPKEIRRGFKINEGDSLEIFVDSNGIVLKKYSLLDDMVESALDLVAVARKVYGKSVIITDNEKVIATGKELKKEYLEKELTSVIKSKIEDRSEFMNYDSSLIVMGSDGVLNYFLVPIIVNSDSLGSVILIDDEITEEDKSLIRFITAILVKKIEE